MLIGNLIGIPFNKALTMGPPNKLGIVRQFKTREGSILPDVTGNGRGAQLVLPTTVFEGTTGSGLVTMTNEIGVSDFTISFKIKTSSDITSLQAILNTELLNPRFRVWIKDSYLIYDTQVSSSDIDNPRAIITPNTLYQVIISRIGMAHKLSVNGIEDINNSEISFIPAAITVGKRAGGTAYLNAQLWDINLNNELFIPLPHLGYGIDTTKPVGQQGVKLTLSDTGIKEGFSTNGSLALIENGVVERNPELVVNGDFTYDGDWIKTQSTISGGSANLMTSDGSLTSISQGLLEFGVEYFYSFDISDIVGVISLDVTGGGVSIDFTTNGTKTGRITALNSMLTFKRKFGINDVSAKIGNVSVTLATPIIIPNSQFKQPAYPLIAGDTFIAGGGMLNKTNCFVRLYELGDTDPSKTFFDRRNTTIWKPNVQNSIYHDTLHPGDWHESELPQDKIYANIQDAYKYMWWTKIVNGQYKDMVLYNPALVAPDIAKAIKYVGVPE